MNKEIFNKYSLVIVAITLLGGFLRLLFLNTIPASLYSDEVAQGYNAYSILKTGKDEHGSFFPVSFRSFGDWKPPLPTYLMVSSIALFGLNAWGIRFPSAILGTVTIPLSYFLTIELFSYFFAYSKKQQKINYKIIALLTAGLLSISPWHILHSRSAMLTSVELFCIILALWTFFKGLRNTLWWFLSSIMWAISIYSYYAMRLIAPLFLFFLFICFRKQILLQKKVVFLASIIAVIFILPLFVTFIKEPDVVFGRAKTVSVFYDQGVPLTVWNLIAQDGPTFNSKLAQFFHNKPYFYLLDIIRRFFQHLDGRFLFLTGDKSPPFQIPNMGILYLIDLPLILLGLVALIKTNKAFFWFLSGWIFVSILPAALTFVTPASNRTFTMIIPVQIIVAFGITKSIELVSKKIFKNFGILTIGIFYIVSFIYFSNQYFIQLPKQYAQWWLYGYEQLYSFVHEREDNFDEIIISGKTSMPYIFLLYNYKIDPSIAQRDLVRNYKPDNFGFEYVDRFQKYRFPRNYSWEKDGTRLTNALLVLTKDEEVGGDAREIHHIYYPNSDTAFKLYEVTQ